MADKLSNEKLLPCPFCGGEAEVHRDKGVSFNFIGCRDTTCVGFHTTSKIEQWNRRACDSRRDETEKEALEKADAILEATQDYLRGATRYKHIRKLIGERIDEIISTPNPITTQESEG